MVHTESAASAPAQINDRYEFPEELDLDAGDGRFLAADADRSVRNLFRLHSVLVHSGGVHGGHYYAFIRPDGKQWLKFDDDKARPRAAPHVAHPAWPWQRSCPRGDGRTALLCLQEAGGGLCQ